MRKAIATIIATGVCLVTFAVPVSAAINPGSQVGNSGVRSNAAPNPGPHCHINLMSDAITGANHNAHTITGLGGPLFAADLDCDGTAG
jgi:hypothetical protein